MKNLSPSRFLSVIPLACLLLAACDGGDDKSPRGAEGGAGTGGGAGAPTTGGTTSTGGTAGTAGAGGSNGGAGGGEPALPTCGSGAGMHVRQVAPADGEAPVLRSRTLTVTMSEELDCEANATPGLTLRTAAGEAVALSAVTCTFESLSFAPEAELEYATDYVLVVDGLVDGTGAAIPACQTTFTTKTEVASVDTGDSASLALDTDGTLWYWSDPLSPMADPDWDATIPSRVAVEQRVTSYAVGGEFALFTVEDGSLYSWGANGHGQLGNGTTETGAAPAIVPLTLPTGVTVTAVAAAVNHALLLLSDGTVMGMGSNGAGQLGLATTEDQTTPVLIPDLTDVMAIAAGQGSSGNGTVDGGWSIALKSDGTVVGLGSNAYGALGVAPAGVEHATPQVAVGVAGVTQVAAASDQVYALQESGELFAWGARFGGALGNATCLPGETSTAVTVGPAGAPLSGVVNVSGGGDFGLAVLTDGTVWGWGLNLSGVLGDGTTGPASTDCGPGFTDLPNVQMVPVQATGVAGAKQVAAGSHQSLVLLTDGTVLAAGSNTNGQLGLPSSSNDTADLVTTFKKVAGL